MKFVHFQFIVAAILLLGGSTTLAGVLDHDARVLGTEEVINLADSYAGKVILVVNTASRCAYTDQYAGLETLYARYRDRGLVVLGFPSNDFAGQEPGSERQISNFCRLTYGVKFPMFAKTHVREGKASPLFEALAGAAGRYPGWNFHKYLIGRDGQVVADFASSTEPESRELVSAIEAQL